MDGENIPTYAVGDNIQLSNETYKIPIAQIGGYEMKWSHENKNGTHYWRCINHNRKNVTKCPAVIYTNGNTSGSEVMQLKDIHNHAGNAVAAERRINRNYGRRLAISNPQLPTRRVIAQVTATSSDALRTEGTANLERMIRYQRQHARVEPPVPRTAEFEIPEELKTMADGSPFVMHDSNADNRDNVPIDGRLLIIGSRATLLILALALKIGGDGSFSRAPHGFMQFYTIFANIRQSYKACKIPFISKTYAHSNYEFHITAEIEFKKVGCVSVPYQLKIESARMKLLKVYEYYEEVLVLDHHEYMKFKYYIKKIRDSFVEIVIENPMEVQIQGKTSDFKHGAPDSADINLNLNFGFDPSELKKSNKHLAIPKSTFLSHQESPTNSDDDVLQKEAIMASNNV